MVRIFLIVLSPLHVITMLDGIQNRISRTLLLLIGIRLFLSATRLISYIKIAWYYSIS